MVASSCPPPTGREFLRLTMQTCPPASEAAGSSSFSRYHRSLLSLRTSESIGELSERETFLATSILAL